MKKSIFRKMFQVVVYTSCLFYTTIFAQFKLGIENIPDSFLKKLSSDGTLSYKVGVITNQTGIDQKGNRAVDILREQGLHITTIFVPEHGLDGTALAAQDVHNSVDKKTGISIYSLYKNGSGTTIPPEKLNDIDVLMFDMQDSGMRHYTYISTLLQTMKVAAEHNKHFVVLDRPNPLGRKMEGPLVEDDLISFISIAPIPLRHGMTIGELAWYFNAYVLDNPAKLHVVPMKHYYNETALNELLTPLSPNISSMQSCSGYSFLGLLGEIEPFDVGVGTDYAFQCILLPKRLKIKARTWRRFEKLLLTAGIKSVPFQHSNKKSKELYEGVRLYIDDIKMINVFNLFVSVVKFFKQEGINISFSSSFDKAAGSRMVKRFINGTLSEHSFFTHIHNQLTSFYQKAEQIFLYKPHPQIVNRY